MVIFVLFFIFVVAYGIRLARHDFFPNYLSKEYTSAIKGVFIVIVFINHIKDYYMKAGTDLTEWYDQLFFLPAKITGQLMVVMFLFYSGYGVAESIRKYGDKYIRKIPTKRVLSTLANFDVAVICFAIACLLLKTQVGIGQFLLSLIGWENMGNSNWYIFCIVTCYLFTYVSFFISRKSWGIICCLLIVIYVITLSYFKGTWWYNTVFAYGSGLMLSLHKDGIILLFKRYYFRSLLIWGSCFLMSLGYYLLFYVSFKSNMELVGALVFNIMSVFFAFFIVLVTMKISIYNKALEWLGNNLFPIYIYQRLPMMVLTTLFPNLLVVKHPYIFLITCLLITGGIVCMYRYIRIDVFSK